MDQNIEIMSKNGQSDAPAAPPPVPAPNQSIDQNIEIMSKNGQPDAPACPAPALPPQRPAKIPGSGAFEAVIRGESHSATARPTPTPSVVSIDQLCDELEEFLNDKKV